MDTHTFFLIMRNEMKLQMRSWVFRFFIVLSLVGIVAYQMYIHGAGSSAWKMVALPCSMPLMNAYLFSVVQSLFLIVIMSEFPQRLIRSGLRDGVMVRPFSNTVYYWGALTGIFLLFLLVNVVEVFVVILLVNSVNAAPLSLSLYFFYILTLNVPCFFFVSGLAACLGAVFSRVFGLFVSLVWFVSGVFWLPYILHGTFDYFSVGVPNLFSDMVGHVNLWGYLQHRLIYLFVGIGLLLLGLWHLGRLPNSQSCRRLVRVWGLCFFVIGLSFLCSLEYSYWRTAHQRECWVSVFERHWHATTSRVKTHVIHLSQSGKHLTASSQMVLYNPGETALDSLVLFLNPGLHLSRVSSGKVTLPYWRDEQVCVINCRLESKDSLIVDMDYAGVLDDRICDLFLNRKDYEDSFCGDHFFPTGRRGAFVDDDILLLTSSSIWYPVALPPVNPVDPFSTLWDFTRFSLSVSSPRQNIVVASGLGKRNGEDISFESERPLQALTVYGINGASYDVPVDRGLSLRCCLSAWGKQWAKKFKNIQAKDFSAYWRSLTNDYENYIKTSWYSSSYPFLHCLECPVSYLPSDFSARYAGGMVEPGAVFVRERLFDSAYADEYCRELYGIEEFQAAVYSLYWTVFADNGVYGSSLSHPFRSGGLYGRGWGGGQGRVSRASGKTVWNIPRMCLFSEKYPFMGCMWRKLPSVNKHSIMLSGSVISNDMVEIYDYFIDRNLMELLSDTGINDYTKSVRLNFKIRDLWNRLVLDVPENEFAKALDSLYVNHVGEVILDSLLSKWNRRWHVSLDRAQSEWLLSRHNHYFRCRGFKKYVSKEKGLQKVEGMVYNAGREGGLVGVECSSWRENTYFNAFVEAGEAKRFSVVRSLDGYAEGMGFFMGLSANRPLVIDFEEESCSEDVASSWHVGSCWETITEEEFMANEAANEYVVDDSDADFELVDANKTMIQHYFPPKHSYRTLQGGHTNCWKDVLGTRFQGDSIRGARIISGGNGKSTATWRATLPKGYYDVQVFVYKSLTIPGASLPSVINHYTVYYGDEQEEIALSLDEALGNKQQGWVSLGNFDFPGGEVKITLSNKENNQNQDIAIIADAVKFVHLE